MEAAPAIGAKAAATKKKSERSGEFLWESIRETVLSPSEKSWAITATAIEIPTVGEIWKPRPIPTPSRNEWAIKARADAMPTVG